MRDYIVNTPFQVTGGTEKENAWAYDALCNASKGLVSAYVLHYGPAGADKVASFLVNDIMGNPKFTVKFLSWK